MKTQLLVLVGAIASAQVASAEEGHSPPDRMDLDSRPAGRPFLTTLVPLANGSGAVQLGAGMSLHRSESLQVAIGFGGLQELDRSSGAFMEAIVAYDVGRLRLGALANLEHLVGPNRDPVDLYAVISASVRVAAPLRVGVSVIAQDLEEAFDDEGADGGSRNYVGPDIAISLDRDRLLLSAGAAFGIMGGRNTPGALARAGLSFFY